MPYVTIDGKKMFYEEVGTGFPIIFGHAYLWNHDLYKFQVEVLSKKYRCILPDLWCHGKSDDIDCSEITIEIMADQMIQFRKTLGIQEYFVAGLSVGCMWAIHMAIKDKGAAKALICIDSYVGAETEKDRIKYFKLMDYIGRFDVFTDDVITTCLPNFYSPKGIEQNIPAVDALKSVLKEYSGQRHTELVKLGKRIFGRNGILDQLPSLNIPVLFMTGRYDVPRPPHEAEEMGKLIPGSRVEIIEDCGHLSVREQPEVTTKLMAEFFDSVKIN